MRFEFILLSMIGNNVHLHELVRSLNEVGVRSKVIAPSLSSPGHYTVYAKGVNKEGVRGAVDRLTAVRSTLASRYSSKRTRLKDGSNVLVQISR